MSSIRRYSQPETLDVHLPPLSTPFPQTMTNGPFYQFVLQYIPNLEMSEEECKTHYYQILAHRFELSAKLGRNVSLWVAVLDYFTHVVPRITDPRFIESNQWEDLLRASKNDPKSGCYNAVSFVEVAKREILRAERNHASLSILMLDIDHFKLINDKHGHLLGDQVIHRFADCLKSCARAEDTIGRFGGDEFVILMPLTGRIGARSLAERLKIQVQSAAAVLGEDDQVVPLTFSGGIATYPYDAKDYDGLVAEADKALYHAKRSGRDKIYDRLEQTYEVHWKDTKERRRAPRYHLRKPIPVDLTGLFPDNHQFRVDAHVINVSQKGCLLECNAKMAPSLERLAIGLAVPLKNPELPGRTFEAAVIRNLAEINYLKFYLGVELSKAFAPEDWQNLVQSGLLEGSDPSLP